MRFRLMAIILVALVATPAAFAHVTLTPTRVAPGADVVVDVVVPNETTGDVIRVVRIDVPRTFAVDGVQTPPGFHRAAGRYDWRGTVGSGDAAIFAFAGAASATATAQRFRVVVRYASGRNERYAPALTVAAPPSSRDRGTHTLALAALIAALAAGAVAVAAFFLALARWLRGSDAPTSEESLQEEKRDSVLASGE